VIDSVARRACVSGADCVCRLELTITISPPGHLSGSLCHSRVWKAMPRPSRPQDVGAPVLNLTHPAPNRAHPRECLVVMFQFRIVSISSLISPCEIVSPHTALSANN
jgi:hypothetical protein